MDEASCVLVVDDDPDIREMIDEYLTDEGYSVRQAANGAEMRERLAEKPVALVVLDLRLPGEDGLALAAELRRTSDVGVIMLSGKDDLVDRVAGLEVGADDYVAKPFHLRELLARVRSVLRRRRTAVDDWAALGDPAPARPASEPGSVLQFNGWRLELDRRELFAPSGEAVELSAGELDLLVVFLRHPRRALSRDRLLDLAHGREASLFDRSIDVQVGRLRRKIESNPKRPELIKTVRGTGYIFTAEVQPLGGWVGSK